MFFFVMRTLRIYSLNNFPIYHTAVLVIVIYFLFLSILIGIRETLKYYLLQYLSKLESVIQYTSGIHSFKKHVIIMTYSKYGIRRHFYHWLRNI